MKDDLIERLQRKTPTTSNYLYGFTGGELVNPDGPEAATHIEQLTAEVERLREAVQKVAVYRVEDDDRIWLSVNGFRVGFYPDDQETEIQKLLNFDVMQRLALNPIGKD